MPANLIACRTGCYGKFKDDAFAHMREIGILHAEVNLLPDGEWDAYERKLAAHGISVSSTSGGVDLSKPEAPATLENLARMAERFGAKVIFLSVKTGGAPKPRAYETLRKLGDLAARHGAVIALETHPDLVTNGDLAAETASNVNHPHVKLNYDSANLYYYNENVDGIAELKKFLPWLGAVHLKETNGKPKTWYFPGLHEGEGIVDFPGIFKLCRERGFHGPYTMEIEGIEGENLTREQVFARMKHSVDYLKSIGEM
ncbi:MAG: sugar phosphate isomerase/epimerase [Planctomycetota bacterium]|nr:sugar phosphate isomerase/epimerase [Planctomycetota bacterium]